MVIFIFSILSSAEVLSSDKIRLPLQYIPSSLVPSLCNDTSCQFVLNNSADGLVGWNFSDGLYPQVASSWSELYKGLVEFSLRLDLKGYDGNAITCLDVKNIFESYMSIKGPFEISYKKIKRLTCTSKYKLEIESDFSTKELLKFLAGPQSKLIRVSSGNRINGIGPFSVRIFRDKILLDRNNFYYNKEVISLKTIELHQSSDKNSIKLYTQKFFDLVLLSNLNTSETISKFVDIVETPLWSTWGIAFNQKIAPFENAALRRCLIDSVSPNKWVEKFYPKNIPAYGPVPFGLLGYSSKPQSSQKKSRKFNSKFKIYLPLELEQASAIGSWLKKEMSNCTSVGNISIVIISFDKMLKKFNNKELSAFLMSFSKETISDEQYYKSFYSKGSENFYNNSSERSEELLSKINFDAREDLTLISEKVRASLYLDALMIPLMHPIHRSLIRSCIKNVILNPINEGYFLIRNAKNLCN